MTERPLLSVVVPVFNQAAAIVENVEVIRQRVRGDLGDDFEIVVVSDGSIDETEDQLVASAPAGAYRVFHYDRNLGKGYAVKLGALEARGEWIGFVDADLDLDPGSLGAYVRRAQTERLDFVIGSKRHPASQVVYPRSRVAASWLFQQLVRVLFRLNVSDTQVGLKVFRRDVAEQVLPLLLVKRFAFDLELLAVGRAFGFDRIAEMPVRLDYRFTGSGVRSRAVLRALVDTAAIFYRLRILRYYQRRRRLVGSFGFTRPRLAPDVSLLLPRGGTFREADHPVLEVVEMEDPSPSALRRAAEQTRGELLAILGPGVRAAGNWLSATTPFLARPEIAAVVTPQMGPATGSVRARAASAVSESRVGQGLGYYRSTPGNVRYVRDFPALGIVLRREALLELGPATALADVVGELSAAGAFVLYTPESVLVADPPPLFRPHVATVLARGRRRGRRAGPVAAAGGVAALAAIVGLAAALGWRPDRDALVVLAAAYLAAVVVASLAAALRYQSWQVGALAAAGIAATHAAYAAGFVRGLAHR